MKTISISNLKDVEKLDFTIPENKGVYLIAGSNGCGKTTLLVCLDRICNSMAFAIGFSSTSSWDAADQYGDAIVTYRVDKKSVSYKKAQARWAPTPKKDSVILEDFGFSGSAFIRADAQRIAVKQDDLKSGNLTTVDRNVKDTLNEIFETNKYDRLMRLKNTNGRGRTSVYFYVIREGNGINATYYSEKRFSTGELAMVRLVEQVERVNNGAMILLDEAELALHPRVQNKLLDYLQRKAEAKNLWFFISTHSPTMLKAVGKEQIFLLKKEGNKTEVKNPCYPAQAIGEVDFAEASIFDYIFFVEDEKAVEILRFLLKRYMRIKPEHATALYNIIPVGGFYETARLAAHTNIRVFADSKVRAVVDQDAFEELDKKPKFNELYKFHKDIIKSLSFTPEMWLIEKIENVDEELKSKIRNEYRIEMKTIVDSGEYKKCNATQPRQLAKAKYNVVLDILSDVACRSREKVDSELIKIIIDSLSNGEIISAISPLLV